MKRNTALKWIGWLGTFGFFIPLYPEIKINVIKTIAYFQYDVPLPITMEELDTFVGTHPDVRGVSAVIFLLIAIFSAMLIGEILAGLFGNGKADKPAEK